MKSENLLIVVLFSVFAFGYEELSSIKNFKTRVYGAIDDQMCVSLINNYIAFLYLCPDPHPDIVNNINITNFKLTFKVDNDATYYQLNDNYNIKINNNDCTYRHEINAIPFAANYNANVKLWEFRKILLERQKNNQQNNIIVGSGSYYGLNRTNSTWIETDQDFFDITRRYDLLQALPANILDNIISTHVFEHLFAETFIDSMITLKYLLKRGGGMFISVPDINAYINILGGIASNIMVNHRFIWSYESLKYVYESLGFEVTPIQYFNENHEKLVNNAMIELMKKQKDLNNILECYDMYYSVAIYVQKK